MSGDWSPDVARLANFDEDEWARVERAYAGRLIAYIGRRVADAEARDDIVQEAFLGAVRGIATFDAKYSFEQYLFGICRNRTIDHLRKRRTVGSGHGGGEDGDDAAGFDLDSLALDEETPSRIVRRSDVQGRGRELLRDALRDWVQDTWAADEFSRLMVIEALFRGGWRNRDTWERFGLRDETAVAGVKFRALKKLREYVAKRDPEGDAVQALAAQVDDGEVPIDVATVWAEDRVSCPARHWIARWIAGTLEDGPRDFVSFHVEEMKCEWCSANRDDLAHRDEEALEPLLVSVRASTAKLLRSRIDRP